jgi:hypothetical protein
MTSFPFCASVQCGRVNGHPVLEGSLMISKCARQAINQLRFLSRRSKCFRSCFVLLVAAGMSVSASLAQSGEEKVLTKLTSPNAYGGLIWDSQGNLYGTTEGSQGAHGTVFQLRPLKNGKWAFRLLYKFSGGTDGAYPKPGLVFDSAGNLYGTTEVGGTNYCNWAVPRTCGTVFELSPTPQGYWTEKIVYSFPGGGGAAIPSTGLVADGAGNLYGGTALGGIHPFDGAVFRLVPQADGTWVEEQLYAFDSDITAGMSPSSQLTLDGAGNVYGTTAYGGSGIYCADTVNSCGTAFQLSPATSGPWTYTLVHAFCSLKSCRDGGYPVGMISDARGNLFGAANTGAVAATNGGTAFEFLHAAKSRWNFRLLHTFCSLSACADGSRPIAAPTRDSAGNLYGPTGAGGTASAGTIYELSPGPKATWNFKTLHDFCADGCPPDGWDPLGTLTLDNAGNVYGTTFAGGGNVGGIVFELIP